LVFVWLCVLLFLAVFIAYLRTLSADGGEARIDMVISFEGLSNAYKADKYEHLSDCLMKWKDGTTDVLYVLGKDG
jgi:hypothetical protein